MDYSQLIIVTTIQKSLKAGNILDYAIVKQQMPSNIELFLVYLVCSHNFKTESMQVELSTMLEPNTAQEQTSSESLEIKICQVSNILRHPDGEINYSALSEVSVIESGLIQALQTKVQSFSGVEQVGIVIEPNLLQSAPYHLSDLAAHRTTTPTIPTSATEHTVKIDTVPADQIQPSSRTQLALSHGGSLNIQPGKAKTMVEAFEQIVINYPDAGIRYVAGKNQESLQTYPQLWTEAMTLLAELQDQQLQPGDYVVLQITKIKDFFSIFWACILGGFIPVNVSVPGNYQDLAIIDKLQHTINLLPGASIIASEELVNEIARIKPTQEGTTSKVLSLGKLRQSQRQGKVHPSSPNDVLFHQLTSGSTGKSKCVQITHKGVVAHINGIAEFNNYSDNDVSLNWLPLDHVAPILMFHLKDLYLGIQQIVVKTELILAQPLRWLEYLEKYRVTHSWTPNFGFKLINDALLVTGQSKTFNLHHVKELMNAGEQVTYNVVKDFLHLTKPFGIKERVMQPSYGMAETCTAITYRNDFELQKSQLFYTTSEVTIAQGLFQPSSSPNKETIFIDLGLPIPGVEMRIVDRQGTILQEGKIGHLHVKGDVITSGYLNNPEANSKVFYPDGWFDTGDLGFIKNGSLVLTGREKETIIIQGANYYSYDIEAVVETEPEVETTFVGACGVIDPHSKTEVLAIFFCANTADWNLQLDIIKKIKKVVSVAVGISPTYIIPMDNADFPKTTSGKIQRGKLKKLFEAGNFAPTIKLLDISTRNERTLPQWFFQRNWQANKGQGTTPVDVKDVIVFTNQNPLTQSVTEVLKAERRTVIRVETGTSLERLNQNHFRIAPGSKADFIELMQQIDRDFDVSHILYLWSYGDNRLSSSPEHHFQDMALLHLAAALGSNQAAKVNLLAIANNSQKILAADLIVAERSLIPGIIRVIEQENPHIHTRHIDLDYDSARNARYILNELLIPYSSHEVAYRNGQRLLAGLRRVDIAQQEYHRIERSQFQQNGIYLVTGGLGGVGYHVCKYLLQEYNAYLLILGRSALDQVQSSDCFRSLKQISSRLEYRQVDITDSQATKNVIDSSAILSNRPLDGVFHLAGVYRANLLAAETWESFQEMTEAKIIGAKILANLLQERTSDGLFVVFSSIFSFFGGSMGGSYAAGNRFLESFVQSLRQSTTLKSFCCSWSNWDNLGMSKGYKNLQIRGYEAIKPTQGLISLEAAMQSDHPNLFIGLDDSRTNISQYCPQQPINSQKLTTYYSSAVENNKQDLPPLFLKIKDCLGRQTNCQLVKLETFSLKANGQIDLEKLRQHNSNSGSSEINSLPDTSTTKKLLDIWKNILKVDTVSINDNFFEVGGSSLSMSMVAGEMSEIFEREFTVAEFFKYPTISTMTTHIDKNPQKIQPENQAKSPRQLRLHRRMQLRKRRQLQ